MHEVLIAWVAFFVGLIGGIVTTSSDYIDLVGSNTTVLENAKNKCEEELPRSYICVPFISYEPKLKVLP